MVMAYMAYMGCVGDTCGMCSDLFCMFRMIIMIIDFEEDCGVYLWSYWRLLTTEGIFMTVAASGIDFVPSSVGVLSHAQTDIQNQIHGI